MKEYAIAALIEQYQLDSDWMIVPGESGMNNTTRMIKAGVERYVLRIYNNHRNRDIVKLEHHVLHALQEQELGFQIPVPVWNHSGETISQCEDGALAAMYRYIPGERPQAVHKAHIQSLGQIAARLSKALGKLSIQQAPIYDPYYLIEETYSSLIQELPMIIQSSEKFVKRADKAAVIMTQLKGLSVKMRELRGLPHQWIHGDLNFSNTVAEGDSIIGVLDFEFCTIDVRPMELVVALIDFFKGEDSDIWNSIQLFCEGYGPEGSLTQEELEALPLLIKLRVLDVFLHFTNRYKEGLDEADILAGFIDQTCRICDWVDSNEKQLLELFQSKLM
ncbi:phosphotransferase [Paenibacillus sp. YAF4_2]|uniref:phosphotransferase n=1 Tax=Paenibacillus sp. YAF4_2 TaxID=3233085 RepID=UPI003F9AF085